MQPWRKIFHKFIFVWWQVLRTDSWSDNQSDCLRTHSSSRTGIYYTCLERALWFFFLHRTLHGNFYCHSPAPLSLGCVRVYKIYHFSTDYWTVMSSIWNWMKRMLIILDVKLGRHVSSSSGDKMSKFSTVYRIVALG